MPTPADDYRALREGAAAFDLEGWRALRLTGADTRDFLQGTASQDLAQAGPDRAAETLFLSEKGRPVAHAWVAIDASGAQAWVIADRGSIDALRPHLERFRIMEDVEFDAPEGATRVAGVAGPGREALLAALASRTPGSRGIAADPLSFLLVPAGAAALPGSAAPEAVEAWRLSRGIPLGGVDFDLDRIATELDLPAAVSFTKGCYVGQEVVARTSNRGQVRRRRVGFRFSWAGAAPGRSTPLLCEGAAVGFLTSAATEPGTGEWLGMGYLATERIDDGSPVGLAGAAGHEAVPIQLGGWPL
jgi:folate-binding protein YgfZ